MQLIKGYPEKIIFKTNLGNTITVSCGKEFIDVSYVTKTSEVKYKIVETQNEKLIMNK